MRTTIELPGSLLDGARIAVRQDRTTLRDLVEQGLREAFTLRDASFRGQGLQPEFHDATWAEIIDAG